MILCISPVFSRNGLKIPLMPLSLFRLKKTLDKTHLPCYNIQAMRSSPSVKYRGVEQLEARRAHNPEVVGSSPASATIKIPGIRYEYWVFSNF